MKLISMFALNYDPYYLRISNKLNSKNICTTESRKLIYISIFPQHTFYYHRQNLQFNLIHKNALIILDGWIFTIKKDIFDTIYFCIVYIASVLISSNGS